MIKLIKPALLLLVSLVVTLASSTQAREIDLTRHLVNLDAGTAAGLYTENFFGVEGNARLMIQGLQAGDTATVEINGVGVEVSELTTIALAQDNTISIALSQTLSSPVSIRVKQIADVELSVESFIHFNTNVSDFETARAFYGKLGLETLSGFPDTNTQAMARAIGIETPTSYDGSQGDDAGGYLLHGEIVGPAGFFGGVIDLISFTIPKDDEPPYKNINHLGMARAAMETTNLSADYEYMKSIGVNFLSEPVTRSNGQRFVMFTDLDGTFYELVEVEGEDEDTEDTHINSMGFLNVNVTDLERSTAWFQMFGYDVEAKLPSTDSIEVANAMGLDEPYEIDGVLLTHRKDGSNIELVQWIHPFNAEPPYPIPVNHLGIHRTALTSSDIEADVAALKAQGVQFVSPITPCCSGEDASSSIVAFYDPDGTIVELAAMPYIFTIIAPVIRFFMELFD
jgi:catechol 2,3-dioxygenase-like lactoylglutathione lyase family enzyme